MFEAIFDKYLSVLGASFGLDFKNDADFEYGEVLRKILSDYPCEAVEKAFLTVLKTCKFRPKVADFIEILEGSKKNQAKAAWGKVLGLLSRYGGLRNKKLLVDGATAHAVNSLGGWRHLSLKTGQELSFLGTNFEALYEGAANNGLNLSQGELCGARDKDFRTQEFLPQTLVPSDLSLEALSAGSVPKQELEATGNYVNINYDFEKLAKAKRLN